MKSSLLSAMNFADYVADNKRSAEKKRRKHLKEK